MSQPNEYIGGKRFGLGFKIKAVIAVFTLLLGAVSVLSFFTLQRFNDQLTEYSEKHCPNSHHPLNSTVRWKGSFKMRSNWCLVVCKRSDV